MMHYLAACSDVVRFFNASGGAKGTGGLELSRTCNVAAAATNVCYWNHNGQVIATAGDDGSITVLKLNGTIVPAGVLSAHELPIYGIAFSSRSRKLAAGGQAGVVEVWDLKRNNSRITLRGHRGPVSCVSFLDRDARVAAGDQGGRVLLHKLDAPPEEEKSPIALPPSEGHAAVTSLAVSSIIGPATLGVSHADGAVRLWDVSRGACTLELRDQHRSKASGIAFHPHNPSLIATVGRDGVVHCVDTRIADSSGGERLRSTETGVPLTCVSFHYEGLIIGVGALDGTVRLVDLRTAKQAGRPQRAFAGPTAPPGGVRDVKFQYVLSRNSNASPSVPSSSMNHSSFSAARNVKSSALRAPVGEGVTTTNAGNGPSSERHTAKDDGFRHSSAQAAPSRNSASVSSSTTKGAAGFAPSSTTPAQERPDGTSLVLPSALPTTSYENLLAQQVLALGMESGDYHRNSATGERRARGGGHGAAAIEGRVVEMREAGVDARREGLDAEESGLGVPNGVRGDNRGRESVGRYSNTSTVPTARNGVDERQLINGNNGYSYNHSGRPTARAENGSLRSPSGSPEHNRRRETLVGRDDARGPNGLNGSLTLSGLQSGSRVDDDDGQFESQGRVRWKHDDEAGDAEPRIPGELAKLKRMKGTIDFPAGFGTSSKGSGSCSQRSRSKGDVVGASAESGGDAGSRVIGMDRSVLEQVLSSHLSELKEELRQEIRNLHVDVLRQFHTLQDEQATAMSGFEERLGGLVAENQALRAENDRLRRVY